MSEFTLPANSKVGEGKHWPAPQESAGHLKSFRIYRWNPEDEAHPALDTFEIDLDKCGPMVLDALVKINDEIDPNLSFRRSCREGVCGSCAMNIDGTNTLACLTPISSLKSEVSRITPLPHLPVLKDLVADLTGLFAQYELIQPWLQSDQAPPDRERLPGDGALLVVHVRLLAADGRPADIVGRLPAGYRHGTGVRAAGGDQFRDSHPAAAQRGYGDLQSAAQRRQQHRHRGRAGAAHA